MANMSFNAFFSGKLPDLQYFPVLSDRTVVFSLSGKHDYSLTFFAQKFLFDFICLSTSQHVFSHVGTGLPGMNHY